MTSRQEKGRQFENNLHRLFLTTTYPVLREQDVRNKYGEPSSAVDHLIICTDYLIAIQDKMISTNACISKINHFIQSTKIIEDIERKKMICIYISPTKITKPSQDSFDHENKQGGKRTFVSLTNSNEDDLINTVKTYFHDVLKIFFYEDDGSCMMSS